MQLIKEQMNGLFKLETKMNVLKWRWEKVDDNNQNVLYQNELFIVLQPKTSE